MKKLVEFKDLAIDQTFNFNGCTYKKIGINCALNVCCGYRTTFKNNIAVLTV